VSQKRRQRDSSVVLPKHGQLRALTHRGYYCPLGAGLLQVEMIRFMNSSNKGTVKAVSPKVGLQTIPFAIRVLRTGPREELALPITSAISPERWGPSPSSAIARR